MGGILFYAFTIAFLNLVVDILYGAMTPAFVTNKGN